MNTFNFEIRHTIQNLSLGQRALVSGVDETRQYLESIGATAGLAWTPAIRSRLYAEILLEATRNTFSNTVNGVLIGSLDQSYAPTVPEALQRYKSRAGIMPQRERIRRLGADTIKQRGLMPPVMKSLLSMKRIAGLVSDEQLFGNLYAEELPAGKIYDGSNAPYIRSTQITPDVVEKLGTTIYDLPEQLSLRGITKLSFGSYNAKRRSQSGRTQLPSWETYLSNFAQRGLIRQVTISLNRSDLPVTSGYDAMARTHRLADELVKDDMDRSKLGPFPEQVACIIENQPPGQTLDFTIGGDVSKFNNKQLRTVYYNLGLIAAS